MSTIYKAQDVATIRATIENRGIDPIQGQPSCYTFKLLNQLCEGAKQVECKYSLLGMMWCCLPQQLYQALIGKNIVAPIQQPPIPPFNDLATPTHNAAIQVTWQKNKELWDQKKNTNKALIEIAKGALDVAHRRLLTNLFMGTPQRTFVKFYNSQFQKWGQVNPHDLVANEEG